MGGLFDLTVSEHSRLIDCETVIERGLKTFVDVGNALLEIRDSRLYRAEYSTFEDYCRERWGWERRHAYRLMDAADAVNNVSNWTQIIPKTESQARPLTSLEPELQREVWQQAVETAPCGKITAAHVQSVVDEYLKGDDGHEFVYHPKPHVANNSGNNEWYTPPEYIEAARRVMGEIDLDPASSDKANETVKALVYFTADNDGLFYPWAGRVWMNPPYASDFISKFCEKLIYHFAIGDVSEAIVLVNNATETAWFQGMLKESSAVCFVKGRIKYLDMAGMATGAPLQGQAVLYFGNKPGLFGNVFVEHGIVLYAAA